jgi:hypothetical protein
VVCESAVIIKSGVIDLRRQSPEISEYGVEILTLGDRNQRLKDAAGAAAVKIARKTLSSG